MSQIASSSGVRVAAQPLSNVYTVLLLIGGLALVVVFVMLAVTMNDRYECVLGVTEEGKRAKEEPDVQKARQDSVRDELNQTDKAIKEFPEGVAAAIGAGVTPPAPEVTTPPAGDATTPPAPEVTTPPAGDATTPPAPEATTPPAGDATTPPAPEATTPAPEGGATPPATPAAGAPAAN